MVAETGLCISNKATDFDLFRGIDFAVNHCRVYLAYLIYTMLVLLPTIFEY